MIPTATELLTAWDAERPRSKQAEMGVSGVGDCRRRAGYLLQGHQPDPEYDSRGNIQAILGTAIHQALAEAAHTMCYPEAEVHAEELEIHFAGLTGHPDLFAEPLLRDFKTVGYAMQLERIRLNGPPRQHRWQIHIYGAGLIVAGHRVEVLQLDYISRDTGEEYLWEGPFDIAEVRAAVDWLTQVRTTPVEYLSRDYRPESAICRNCPFYQQCWDAIPERSPRTALWRDWPSGADWAVRLEEAQLARKQAHAAEDDAKGALDALRTVTAPGDTQLVAVPGLDGKVIRFSVTRGRQTPDADQIQADYARVGAAMPLKRGEPTVKVTVVRAPP